MNLPEHETARLCRLCDAVVDGTASGKELAALRKWLNESEPARMTYLRYMDLSAQLFERDRSRGGVRPEVPVTPGRWRVLAGLSGIAAAACLALGIGLLLRPADRALPVAKADDLPMAVEPIPTGETVLAAVEISGSMVGDGRSYAAVEAEIMRRLRGLEPGTRFNVVAFSTEQWKFRPDPVWATPANLDAAASWLDAYRPDADGHPEWPGGDWRSYKGGRHVGADIPGTFARCFEQSPTHILYAADWVSDPGTPRVKKQTLIEQLRSLQKASASPVRIDTVVYAADADNQFLGALSRENGGELIEAARRGE